MEEIKNIPEVNNNKPSDYVFFGAINPYVETNIVFPTECENRGRDFINWGVKNDYPEYLHDLYQNVTTLQTCVDGSVNYVCGDDIFVNVDGFERKFNQKGDVPRVVIANIAKDYFTYGGFALEVLRNAKGEIAEVNYLDFKKVRSDKKGNILYYSDDWSKSAGRVQTIMKPRFKADNNDAASIYYYKNNYTTTYPIPAWASAVKSCEIEKSIDEYQLNAVNNGFMASYLISFNNGIPAPDVQDLIEDEVNEKFAGSSNAGRIMINFAKDKDHAVEVQKLEQINFGEQYDALAKRSQNKIYECFKASPVIFGVQQENTGFNDQDYQQGFKLYNKTVILPAQSIICDAFNTIFNNENAIEIAPFTIDWSDNEKKEIVD